MGDLEDATVIQAVKAFSKQMRAMRDCLDDVEKFNYKYTMKRQFLGAVDIYCEAVERLLRDLCALDIRSRAFLAFCEFLTEYVASLSFRNLLDKGKFQSPPHRGSIFNL